MLPITDVDNLLCLTVKANIEADEADRLPDEELLGQVSCVVSSIVVL